MISVVIPTLNEEKYLEATLKSVREQDEPNEIIVVDGGSTDKTVAIARRYANHVLKTKYNVSKSRNEGAFLANADVILFLDADTVLMPGALKAIREAFKPGVVGVCPNVSSDGPLQARIMYKLLSAIGMSTAFIRVPVFYGLCMAWRRDDFESIGGFDSTLRTGEDLRLTFKMHNRGRCLWLRNARVVTSHRRIRGRLFFRYCLMHFRNFFSFVLLNKPAAEYPQVR